MDPTVSFVALGTGLAQSCIKTRYGLSDSVSIPTQSCRLECKDIIPTHHSWMQTVWLAAFIRGSTLNGTGVLHVCAFFLPFSSSKVS